MFVLCPSLLYLRWCVDKNAFSLTPTHFCLRDGSQSQRALSLHQVSQGPQWLWPPATFLTTCNFSRSVLGSPIRPRASRLYWSVPGFLFLFNSKSFNPNGFLDNGHMIFENSIIQIGRKLAEDSLVLLLIHLFARFRCCCELVSSSHLLQSTNPPCLVLTILNFISVHIGTAQVSMIKNQYL